MHGQVADNVVGSAQKKIAGTKLGEVTREDAPADGGGSASGKTTADVNQRFSSATRNGGRRGNVLGRVTEDQVAADDRGRRRGITADGVVDEDRTLVDIGVGKDLQRAAGDALVGVNPENVHGAGNRCRSRRDGHDLVNVRGSEIAGSNGRRSKLEAFPNNRAVTGEASVTECVGGRENIARHYTHSSDIDARAGHAVDIGGKKSFTAGGGHAKLAVDGNDDQSSLIRAGKTSRAGSAQLRAEARCVLQADVGATGIVDVAAGRDRQCRRCRRLEQAQDTAIDGDGRSRVERLGGGGGVSAAAADDVAGAGLRTADDKHGSQAGLGEGARAEVVDAGESEGGTGCDVDVTGGVANAVDGAGGREGTGDQESRRHGDGSLIEKESPIGDGVAQVVIAADSGNTGVHTKAQHGIHTVEHQGAEASLEQDAAAADVAVRGLGEEEPRTDIEGTTRRGRTIRHVIARRGHRGDWSAARNNVLINRLFRDCVPEAKGTTRIEEHQGRVGRNADVVTVDEERARVELGDAAVGGRAREGERSTTSLHQCGWTGTNTVNDAAGEDRQSSGVVVSDGADR